ncbi:MAG: NADH-quinone oxidoreductase subunit N, partial [Phycisphaerae bacterium]
YMLVGLLVGPLGAGPMRDGITAVLFYIAIYGVMNLGAFAVLACLQVRGQEAEDIDEIAGLARRDGVLALVMAICVFSLMGMPPTAGFLAKVYIFGSALASYTTAMIVLAVIGVVNSAIAAAYYLRIVGACYLRDPIGRVQPTRGFPLRLGMALCSVIVLAVGIGPNNLLRCTDQAGQDLQPARVSERVVVRPSPGAPSWLDRQDATADRPASAADPPPSNPPQAWRRF